jgi:hypothetical protein
MSGVAFSDACVFSLSFHLHLFVACIVRRADDILKMSYMSGVCGNPLIPGLMVDLESASFWVQGGLRVHVKLVNENSPASMLGGIPFPLCCSGSAHSESAAYCVTEADNLVWLLVYCNDGSRRCLE